MNNDRDIVSERKAGSMCKCGVMPRTHRKVDRRGTEYRQLMNRERENRQKIGSGHTSPSVQVCKSWDSSLYSTTSLSYRVPKKEKMQPKRVTCLQYDCTGTEKGRKNVQEINIYI